MDVFTQDDEIRGMRIEPVGTLADWLTDAERSQWCPAIQDWPQRLRITARDGSTAFYDLGWGPRR